MHSGPQQPYSSDERRPLEDATRLTSLLPYEIFIAWVIFIYSSQTEPGIVLLGHWGQYMTYVLKSNNTSPGIRRKPSL